MVRRNTWMRGWRLAALIAAAAVVVGGAGAAVIAGVTAAGGGDGTPSADEPRPLTVEESERLAVARFLNFEAGGVEFTTAFDSPEGAVEMHGVVDYASPLGSASMLLGGQPVALQWSETAVAFWPGVGDGDAIPASMPATPAAVRPLDPQSTTFDTVLVVLGSLASDRPENASLLQQAGTQWLRSDTVDGVAVDVIAGPSGEPGPSSAPSGEPGSAPGNESATPGSTTFWIDESGNLLRFEADLPTGPLTIDLDASGFVPVERSDQLP